MKKIDYLTVVIQMPEDPSNRRLIVDAIGMGKTFHGGVVTAMSLEDEITLNEQLIDAVDSSVEDSARLAVKRIHQEALLRSEQGEQPVVGGLYLDDEEDLTVTVTEVFTDRVYYTGEADGNATLAEFNKRYKPVPDSSDD